MDNVECAAQGTGSGTKAGLKEKKGNGKRKNAFNLEGISKRTGASGGARHPCAGRDDVDGETFPRERGGEPGRKKKTQAIAWMLRGGARRRAGRTRKKFRARAGEKADDRETEGSTSIRKG